VARPVDSLAYVTIQRYFQGHANVYLVKGRFRAAEIIVKELSIESLSQSRTEALCGYPFDFTQPGADEQNEAELYNHRKNPANAAARAAMSKESLTAERHAATVHELLEASAPYHDLQLIVRLLQLFRDWREEEEQLIL
jgi:nuclear pore complex protein Nup107